jgi:uncharacterized membrane protein
VRLREDCWEVIVLEKMIVVVFDNESKAYDGTNALRQLDNEGSITVHAEAVIKKNADGTMALLKARDEFPIRTVAGTAIGSLIGLLGGPVGLAVGAGTGSILGVSGDLYVSGVNADFVDEASTYLTAGKFAVVADISEEWVTPLDVSMEKLGGLVCRIAKRHVEIEQMKSDIAALDAEIAQLKKEMKSARDEQKAKLQAKIDKLKEKRQKKTEQAKQRLEQIKKEHDAKVGALKEKAAKARSETKAAIEARVTQINKDYQRTLIKWKNLEAERLEKTASRLEKRAKKLRGQTN